MIGATFIVAPIDENRGAPGAPPGIHVAPPIADHEAVGERNPRVARRRLQQSRFRLPALAAVAIVMIADAELVDRERRSQPRVHAVDHLAPLRAARHVGLVGDHDQAETGGAQPGQRLRHARQDLQRGLGCRRERPAVTDDWTIDYAVPVEEDGAPNASVDSHFVCAALSAGCDTRRCHTTAWNASECGVMLSAFTVGTMTHASATCAV